jgi:hypothetical protein
MSSRSATRAVSLGAAVLALAAGIGCGSATDDRPAKWSFISAAIVEPSCATASCHSDTVQKAGVNLFNRDIGYKSLVDRHFVYAGSPDTSELIFLLRAQGAKRMPPDFALPEEDIQLISDWILKDKAQND